MVTSKTTTMATTLPLVAAIFVTALINVIEAQSPVPAPTYSPEGMTSGTTVEAPGPAGPDCMSALFNLSDCLTFVEEGSNLTKPDKPCCPELSTLVDTQPICLCKLLGSDANSLGLSIDVKRALKLPSACGVTIPDLSLCSMVGVPVSLPSSPGGAPKSSVGLAPGGDAFAPSSTNPGNGASSTSISGLWTFVCVAMGSFGAFLMI